MLLSVLLFVPTFIPFIIAYEEPKHDKFFVDFKKLIKSSAKFNAKAIGDWALLKGCEIVDTMHKTPRHWHLLERSAELFQMGQIATNICYNSNVGQNVNDVAVGYLLQTISLNGQIMLAQIKAKECKTSAGGQNAKGNNELFKFGKYFKSFLAEMPEGQWKSELMELVKSKGQISASDLFALLLNKLDDKNEWTDNILGKIFHESEVRQRVRRYDPDLHNLHHARLQHNLNRMALNVRVDDDADDIYFYEPDIAPRFAERDDDDDDDMTFYEQDIAPNHDKRSDKFSVFPPKIIVFLFSIGLAAANLALIAISMLLLGFYLEMIR
uniref:Uncharacterized protein n=1 Tax=Globodera rostochiensis TaxID=31243 RepID=A0A914I8L0_GLORO